MNSILKKPFEDNGREIIEYLRDTLRLDVRTVNVIVRLFYQRGLDNCLIDIHTLIIERIFIHPSMIQSGYPWVTHRCGKKTIETLKEKFIPQISYEINSDDGLDGLVPVDNFKKEKPKPEKPYYIAVFKKRDKTRREFVDLGLEYYDTGLYEYDFVGFYARVSYKNNIPILNYNAYITNQEELKNLPPQFYSEYYKQIDYLATATIIRYQLKREADKKIKHLKDMFGDEYKYRVVRFFS